MIPSRADTSSRGHSDPMDVDAVNFLSLSAGQGERVMESARRNHFGYGKNELIPVFLEHNIFNY